MIANQFIIGEMNLDHSHEFLASDNMFAVAARTGLWNPQHMQDAFHFSKVFGMDHNGLASLCSRRMWRVFSLAAPSIPISPFTDSFMTFGFGEDHNSPYPFSVKTEKLLRLTDIMAITRDQYEGTLFDMTKGSGTVGSLSAYSTYCK